MRTLTDLQAALAAGKTTSLALTEAALDRAGDKDGEGKRVFIRLFAEGALEAARASDALRRRGIVPSPIAGIPISVKDLFDVAGLPTTAGSKLMQHAPPASEDAVVVARLRAAGAIVIGRTNMTEFAYSGLGLNPHYGTPRNPWDRHAGGRVPGGSSSGAAVSVADGMAAAAIGTDTGGSVRIPAAACGLVGFKPTSRRVSLAGVLPLASSLDSVGPIAASVACCALLDAILSGASADLPDALPLAGLRLAVPAASFLLQELDPEVSTAFSRALAALSAGGARISEIDFPELAETRQATAGGGLTVIEAYAWHRELLAKRQAEYDPRVASRMLPGAAASAADYIDLVAARGRIIAGAERRLLSFDAWLAPTLPCVPPAIAPLEASEEAYRHANMRMLRNTAPVNFLDGCALSIPCHPRGAAPVGLMVAGPSGSDRRILALGLAIDAALRQR
jgi:aspartyl-tRNA(Asn)/glutamyl-tRNA(Gln) amidotransferase subunit A